MLNKTMKKMAVLYFSIIFYSCTSNKQELKGIWAEETEPHSMGSLKKSTEDRYHDKISAVTLGGGKCLRIRMARVASSRL